MSRSGRGDGNVSRLPTSHRGSLFKAPGSLIVTTLNSLRRGIAGHVPLSESSVPIEARIRFLPKASCSFRHPAAFPEEVYHHCEPCDIHIFRDVRVWVDHSVVIHDGKLIDETAFSPFRRRQLLRQGRRGYRRLRREYGYSACLDGGPWNNYYHWFVDTLPRLFALHHPEVRRLHHVKLFTCRALTDTEREIIYALIPENVELVQTSDRTCLRAEHYIHLPFLNKEWSGFLPSAYLEHYRRALFALFGVGRTTGGGRQNIFISRRLADVRRITNEREVASMLETAGFATYCLETLPVKDQAELFASAGTVVGQHGAGLTNLLYATDARVLEIFSSNYPGLHHYRLLAAAMGHDYANLHCGTLFRRDELQVPWKMGFDQKRHVDADIAVPLDQLAQKLDALKQSVATTRACNPEEPSPDWIYQ